MLQGVRRRVGGWGNAQTTMNSEGYGDEIVM